MGETWSSDPHHQCLAIVANDLALVQQACSVCSPTMERALLGCSPSEVCHGKVRDEKGYIVPRRSATMSAEIQINSGHLVRRPTFHGSPPFWASDRNKQVESLRKKRVALVGTDKDVPDQARDCVPEKDLDFVRSWRCPTPSCESLDSLPAPLRPRASGNNIATNGIFGPLSDFEGPAWKISCK